MIGVCVECGKRFEINENENLSDYQCSCGGRLLNGLEDSEFKRINNEKGPIIPKSTNLIECPDCGKEISNKASVCLNCGFPTGIHFMTQWHVVKSNSRKDFLKEIAKNQSIGYVLVPESYTIGGGSTQRIYSALMKKI
ncbi:MAG: hypothetical protein KO318_05995 [Methanobacterium sp.]|jgi:DNA-directed RNA polymerase subunit RPC12/RpoP|uniref:hypothetical protein n=1 Tax=Methanobacterium sp. TaxID=2164 RepID=UPI00258EC8AA|nr:hypothetical protein [Methanobacterium sp.]MCC7559965.1 hypothetical protein [Methanobacterium sp.]